MTKDERAMLMMKLYNKTLDEIDNKIFYDIHERTHGAMYQLISSNIRRGIRNKLDRKITTRTRR